ncbi:hypothetical protein EDC04DRAFT_3091845 [Pisolithus marmoratus]|nr:hypothetical protein EDC04DRAFT_3091845 [Pisolithus marmoratus]
MTSSAPLDTVQRETCVLDTFVAIKTREDLFTDASGFHLGRHELFIALFDAAVLRTSSVAVACAKASYASHPPVQSALAPPHPSATKRTIVGVPRIPNEKLVKQRKIWLNSWSDKPAGVLPTSAV